MTGLNAGVVYHGRRRQMHAAPFISLARHYQAVGAWRSWDKEPVDPKTRLIYAQNICFTVFQGEIQSIRAARVW